MAACRTEATLRALTEQWIFAGSHIVSNVCVHSVILKDGKVVYKSTVLLSIKSTLWTLMITRHTHNQSVKNMWMRAKCKI